MKLTARAVLGFVVASGLVLAACSDRTITQPTAAIERGDGDARLLGGLLGGVGNLLFAPLQRDTPLASNVSWTFTVGSAGGSSSNSSVGLYITIPSGALSSTKTITVTALAGANVAYNFSPHIEFNKKIYLTQDLSGTSTGLLGGLLLKGAHFTGSAPTYNSSGLAIVDEIVSGLHLPWMQTFTFGVDHFSGWITGNGVYSGPSEEGW
jgi:hypothetical protein